MDRRRMRKLLGWARLLFGLALIAALLLRLKPLEVLGSLGRASPVAVGAAVLAQIVGKLVWTARWREILAAVGEKRSFGDLLQLLFIGLFFNMFLPTGMGGDAVRGFYTSRPGRDRFVAYAVVVVERVLGMITLAATAAAASLVALAAGETIPAGVLVPVVVAGGGISIAGVLLFSWRGWRRAVRSRWRGGRLARTVEVFEIFHQPGTRKGWLILNSLAVQLVAVVFYLASARAVGLATPALAFFLVVPAASIAAMLPVSVNGLGVREGVLVSLLTAFGAPAQQAAGCAILALLLSSAFSLAGGALYALKRPGMEPGRLGADS